MDYQHRSSSWGNRPTNVKAYLIACGGPQACVDRGESGSLQGCRGIVYVTTLADPAFGEAGGGDDRFTQRLLVPPERANVPSTADAVTG